ncbi:MAG: trypsin-like peptidase domain-containing protein [Phycisphaerales bacterium]|nr:trypsin-like peptidase domain-containing protein [Phycisphaerales bacterium]
MAENKRSGVSNGLLAVMLFVMAGYIAIDKVWPTIRAMNARPREITPRGDLADAEKTTIDIFNAASPSVVFITNAQLARDRITRDVMSVPAGSGSGVIWDDLGHVLTNLHVVAGADQLIVTLPDQTSWQADLVGWSERYDLAVLQMSAPASSLRPIPIGESANLQVGQTVFAIGNPFGLDQTLTTGIISALHREIPGENGRELQDMIQTDAAINPGNSGGPLLDSAGRLIGVNTAIFSPTRTNLGIGFATPVDVINEVVPQLIAHGREIKPYLGVYLDEYVSARLGIEGVMIVTVLPESPADKAGLQPARIVQGRLDPGDIILAIDGTATPNRRALEAIIDRHDVGDRIELTINRDGREATIEVLLETARPAR